VPVEHTYDYAIIRVVPRVDRGELINVGGSKVFPIFGVPTCATRKLAHLFSARFSARRAENLTRYKTAKSEMPKSRGSKLSASASILHV